MDFILGEIIAHAQFFLELTLQSVKTIHQAHSWLIARNITKETSTKQWSLNLQHLCFNHVISKEQYKTIRKLIHAVFKTDTMKTYLLVFHPFEHVLKNRAGNWWMKEISADPQNWRQNKIVISSRWTRVYFRLSIIY